MTDSIFAKIIKGEVPSHKIYEDDFTYAFLDIHPIQPGHVLVVSKKQVDHLWDLPDEDYQALMSTLKKVANKLRKVLNPKRVGIQVIGIDVAHAHIHVVPFNTVEEFRKIPDQSAKSDTDLEQMARKLAF